MKRIDLKVITRAKREGIERLSESSYRLKVSVPPEKGRANKKTIELLSAYFGVKKSDIKIVAGAASNKKILEIPA